MHHYGSEADGVAVEIAAEQAVHLIVTTVFVLRNAKSMVMITKQHCKHVICNMSCIYICDSNIVLPFSIQVVRHQAPVDNRPRHNATSYRKVP